MEQQECALCFNDHWNGCFHSASLGLPVRGLVSPPLRPGQLANLHEAFEPKPSTKKRQVTFQGSVFLVTRTNTLAFAKPRTVSQNPCRLRNQQNKKPVENASVYETPYFASAGDNSVLSPVINACTDRGGRPRVPCAFPANSRVNGQRSHLL